MAEKPSPSSRKVKVVVRRKVPKSKTSKPLHPSTIDMVFAAVAALRERNGSSLQAIKKYIAVTYSLDANRFAPYIKKYIKLAVASGDLLQIRGKGASGSFKLSNKRKVIVIKKRAAQSAGARKATGSTKPAIAKKSLAGKTSESKTKIAKKSITAGKPAARKLVSKVTKKAPPAILVALKAASRSGKLVEHKAVRNLSKVKNSLKAPTRRPKAPKPKKIVTPKSGPKKTVPVKK